MTTQDAGVEAWLAKTGAEIRHGEFLMAYDLAMRGLEAFPENELLKYHAVLALARSGATERAEELYGVFNLQDSGTEDTASLGARIAKDKYFAENGRSNPEDATRAAQLYQEVFEKSGGYYPAINAATMWFFSGDEANSARMANLARERSGTAEKDESAQSRYWRTATRAEASLLLDELDDAKSAIDEAATLVNGDFSAAASTRGQLLRICAAKGLDASLIDPLKPPSIIYYSGHMIARAGRAGQFGVGAEELVRNQIDELLKKYDVGFGFGSLACGSDILFAEALLARGAELNVVIPFDLDEFTEISVSCGGPGWKERMHDCLSRATAVTHATRGSYLGDDSLFNYAARMAMGFARIKAQNLSTDVNMFAVWNGQKPKFQAGTAVDVAFWRERDLSIETIDCGPPSEGTTDPAEPTKAENHSLTRKIYPVAFADIKGFSKLSDNELARFFEKVMGRLSGVMDKYGDSVLFRNTWGDAVHAVFGDVASAANCALEMQKTLQELDSEAVKLPVHPEMRMALDVGPVFEGYDFIKKEETYFGSTLTRAARMEPVTPVREVFVTEAFAALSAMECADDIRCEYVGHLPLAHAYGDQRMYLLRQNSASPGTEV
ncbi:MAG: adenylate/guanylate cyclase domain-containing protein [Pseudomonadota bacterium]